MVLHSIRIEKLTAIAGSLAVAISRSIVHKRVETVVTISVSNARCKCDNALRFVFVSLLLGANHVGSGRPKLNRSDRFDAYLKKYFN